MPIAGCHDAGLGSGSSTVSCQLLAVVYEFRASVLSTYFQLLHCVPLSPILALNVVGKLSKETK
jgi:hypothetical protein